MFGLFFTNQTEVKNFNDATLSDSECFNRWFHGMLSEGIYLAPSPYEAGFLSFAHDDEIIGRTIEAAARVAQTL